MCCPGCRAVAGLIAANGLERFYEQRTAYNQRPEQPANAPIPRPSTWIYDDDAACRSSSTQLPTNRYTCACASLLIGGVTCAACTWLIEKTLKRLDPGGDAIGLAEPQPEPPGYRGSTGAACP
jgi:Cu2+-exporting ATPase